jgi:hypothetical protein
MSSDRVQIKSSVMKGGGLHTEASREVRQMSSRRLTRDKNLSGGK